MSRGISANSRSNVEVVKEHLSDDLGDAVGFGVAREREEIRHGEAGWCAGFAEMTNVTSLGCCEAGGAAGGC